MDRATTLRRRILVLAALCVAFLAILLLRSPKTSETPADAKLDPAFPPLEVAKVRVLEVERAPSKDGKRPAESVRLVRQRADAWALDSHHGYPADAKKVEDFLKKLADVRVRSTPTTNPEKFAAFAGDDGWTDIRVYDEREAPILSFGIGKGGAEGSWSNVYLRVDDLQKGSALVASGAEYHQQRQGRVVASTGLDAWGNRSEPTFWVETRLFPGLTEADLTEVAWEHPPKSWSGRLVRGTKAAGAEGEDPWTLSGTHSGAAKPATARLYAQAFVGLPLAGLEDGKETPETDAKYGFDQPDLVITARGRAAGEGALAPEWKVVVGKKAEGKSAWYARRSGPAGREPWVFAVNDYDLSRFRDDPKDLLETPPPAPPAEPTTPAMGEAPPAPPAEPTTPAMGEAPPAPAAPGEAPKDPSPPSDPPMGEAPPPAPVEGPAK